MTLGDRIVIMKDGVIQQIGTPQEVFDHPYNLFVAGFIGMPQMNFFDAELVEKDGAYSVKVGGIEVALSAEKQERLKAKQVKSQEITLGVRPEHITLLADDQSGIHGTIEVAEMMGSAVHLHASACGKDTIIIVDTMNLDKGQNLSIGANVQFTFDGNVAHVFSKDGLNLEMK